MECRTINELVTVPLANPFGVPSEFGTSLRYSCASFGSVTSLTKTRTMKSPDVARS